MRFAIDTGGTFTDLIVERRESGLHMFKASTTPDEPIRGVLDALGVAANAFRLNLRDMLAAGESFVYGTTHAINAIITQQTARTAFLTTAGHPDVLVLREGGRAEPFNFKAPYPEPYAPRSLTFEVPGRILANGAVSAPFDDAVVLSIIERMRAKGVQAVAVCLLWSIINPEHELRLGELLERHLPGVPYTLSHQLNPTLREYRRASSTAIDASLKPMMQSHMRVLVERLRSAGFAGRVLAVTSQGSVVDAAEVARTPIHLINSGPSMAPVSGRYFANLDEATDTAIIADTGGTTYDVSLVRRGRIPWTRETWIGKPYRGHMTGFPSVDVKSVGAGGGSIAWVDEGGLLHVGPQSAGAVPGPVCYGKGGVRPTVTDAALALGYIDANYFLGGAIKLDVEAARRAMETYVAIPLSLSIEEAAVSILDVVTENMVQAIMDITVNQGIDPAGAVLVGGGGAAGINSVAIARRLGAPKLLIPEVGPALSAAGGMFSNLSSRFHVTRFVSTKSFDYRAVNAILSDLSARCQAFFQEQGGGSIEQTIEFSIEARYPEQVWEITVPLAAPHFEGPGDVQALETAFHAAHAELFAFSDSGSPVEVIGWSATATCRLTEQINATLAKPEHAGAVEGSRKAYFRGPGLVDARVRRFEAMTEGERVNGPAIIESAVTAVVVNPGAVAERRPSGSLSIEPGSSLEVSP